MNDAPYSTALEWLQNEFASRKTKNPAYSLRSFARDCSLSPSQISRILSLKIQLTEKTLDRITESLEIDEALRLRLCASLQSDKEDLDLATIELEFLTPSESELLQNPHAFALRELRKVKDFKPDISWIGETLGLSEEEATQLLESFLAVEKTDSKFPNSLLNTRPKRNSKAWRNLHHALLIKQARLLQANETLTQNSDLSFFYLALDESLLPEFVQRFRDFRHSIIKWAKKRSHKKDSLIQVSTGILPILKPEIP